MFDNFAYAIRTRRALLRFTEDEVARRIGKPLARYQALELGAGQPTVGEARSLAALLQIPLAVLRDLLTMDREGIPLNREGKQ